MLLWGLIFLLPILPNLWGIWHVFRNDFHTALEKMAWIGACVFVPVLGGLFYIAIGRKRILPPLPEQQYEKKRTEE